MRRDVNGLEQATVKGFWCDGAQKLPLWAGLELSSSSKQNYSKDSLNASVMTIT